MRPHPRHRLIEARLVDGLQYVVNGARIEGAQRVLAEGGGEHHHRQDLRAQVAQELEAVEAGHLDVEEQEVRRECRDGLQRLGGIAAFADDADVRVCGERLAQRQPRQHFVVDQERADRGGVHAGCS